MPGKLSLYKFISFIWNIAAAVICVAAILILSSCSADIQEDETTGSVILENNPASERASGPSGATSTTAVVATTNALSRAPDITSEAERGSSAGQSAYANAALNTTAAATRGQTGLATEATLVTDENAAGAVIDASQSPDTPPVSATATIPAAETTTAAITDTTAATSTATAAAATTKAPAIINTSFELAFISDFGLIGDESISQATWEGITRFATENAISSKHYVPKNQSVGAYLEAIDQAVAGGAKLIATSGILYEIPIWYAQYKYPDIYFILVDGAPHNDDYSDETILENVSAIRFNASEAGFLAGYAAVKAGMKSLGYIGAMPTPEIASTGLGFLQGAEYAANELEFAEGSININYMYFGSFLADAGIQFLAEEWYGGGFAEEEPTDENGEEAESGGGVELIYAAGGELEHRVALAASLQGKYAILYDSAGAGGETNATGAPHIAAVVVKNYADAVYDSVYSFYERRFPGGEITVYGASEGCIGLRFADNGDPLIEHADYVKIISALASGAIEITDPIQYPYAPPSIEALTLAAITVIME